MSRLEHSGPCHAAGIALKEELFRAAYGGRPGMGLVRKLSALMAAEGSCAPCSLLSPENRRSWKHRNAVQYETTLAAAELDTQLEIETRLQARLLSVDLKRGGKNMATATKEKKISAAQAFRDASKLKGLTDEQIIARVKKVSGSTKFNAAHLAWYRSMAKQGKLSKGRKPAKAKAQSAN